MALNKTALHRTLRELSWQLGKFFLPNDNRVRGWYGEWLARKYLKKKNFSILYKNWQSNLDGRREIDLVAKDKKCLVFVEVRARSSRSLNSGLHSINQRKRKAIYAACKDFLRLESTQYSNYRFDVIEVDLDEEETKVLHHENVSLFP